MKLLLPRVVTVDVLFDSVAFTCSIYVKLRLKDKLKHVYSG